MSAYPHGSTLRIGLCLALTAMLPLAHAAVHRAASHAAPGHAPAARAGNTRHDAAVSRKHTAPHATANARAQAGRSQAHAPLVSKHAAQVAQAGNPRRGRLQNAHSSRHAETAEAPARRTETRTANHPVLEAKRSAPAASMKFPAHDASASRDTADRATADRVHAWYKSRQAANLAQPEEDDAADGRPATLAAAAVKPAAARPTTQHVAEAQPDLSVTPHKATVEDFDRALKKQTEVVRQVAAVNQTRTSTADDEAAFVEQSHIPSTAPTERVATPFTHGEMPGGAAVAVSVTPKPAPAAPRAATIAAAKPIDPAVMNSLAEETFGTDDSPAAAAKTAVQLAAKNARPDPVIVKPVLSPAPDALDTDLPAIAAVKVNLYDGAGKLIMLPPMKGTHEILVHQNQMALADGLDRIEDDYQLAEMRRRKLLVALPDNSAATVDVRLPMNRRYARPWSVRFLNDLSRAHYARFGTPLIVTSAARTVAFQRRLIRTNANAAPPSGNIASPHLYGQALDIAKHGMSVTEIAWMRAYLTPVEDDGKIDVEEEFQQACFHISIYRRYLGLPSKKIEPLPETIPSRTLEQVKTGPAPTRRRHLPAILATGLR